MKPLILRTNDVPRTPAHAVLPASYDVAVALDRRMEYRRILPLLANHLISEAVELDGESSAAVLGTTEERLKQLDRFRQIVDHEPYVAGRSFALHPDEAEVVPQLLMRAEPASRFDGAEVVQRHMLACDIMRCLGEGWVEVMGRAAVVASKPLAQSVLH